MRTPGLSRHGLTTGSEGAFTFIENIIVVTIVLLFFAALYAINSQSLFLLNAGRGAAIAGKCLQDRAEQLRNCTWSQLTDANYLKNNVLNTSPLGVTNLGLVTETVTVTGELVSSTDGDMVALSPPITVVRNNGSTTITSSNAAIANVEVVRVDSSLTWIVGIGARTRTQATSTIIAKNIP